MERFTKIDKINNNYDDDDDNGNDNGGGDDDDDMVLMNQTMFLKFILFNQDMFRMNHHPSSVVQNKTKLCNKYCYTSQLKCVFWLEENASSAVG